MKIEYDKEANSAYIYIKYPIKNGESNKTIKLNDNILLDFDNKGQLLGIEILNARKIMDKKLLLEAQHA